MKLSSIRAKKALTLKSEDNFLIDMAVGKYKTAQAAKSEDNFLIDMAVGKYKTAQAALDAQAALIKP